MVLIYARCIADFCGVGGFSQTASVAGLILTSLKKAYRGNLYILYTPAQPFSADTPEELQERVLLAECRTQGIECRSLRDRMVNELVINHNLARGFSDSAPGMGHFNPLGHQLVAAELDDWLNSSR